MKRSHILSFTPDIMFGGDAARLLSFARTVDRDRFEHTVVTIKTPWAAPEESADMRAQYAAAGIPIGDLGQGPFPLELDLGFSGGRKGSRRYRAGELAASAAVFARLVTRLAKLIRRSAIDVIDARLEVAGVIAVAAGRLTGTPVVVTSYYLDTWQPLFMRLPGQFTMGFADVVMTDSHVRGRDFRQWTWRPRPVSRFVVVPNGIYPPAPTRPADVVRAELGLNPDAGPIVATVARLSPFKGQKVLVEAARAVLDARPDAAFLMVGCECDRFSRDYRRELEARAAALGIGDRVVVASYPGPIGDVWNIIDVHVHASMFDSLPISVQEGMSLGKPAVVTSVGGIPEMVEHERTGLVVAPGDAGALGRAILRLLQDPPTASRLGRAAAQRYEERYRPEAMTRELESLFAELTRC